MRIKSFAAGLMAATIAVSGVATPVLAGVPKYILQEAYRPVADSRAVHVLVGQEELKSNINPSMVGTATGGGLLGALIDIQIQADRAKKAEAAIGPLRTVMTGFDADALAQASAEAAVRKLDWFRPGAMSFGRDVSQPGRIAVLDGAQSSQVAFIEYIYDLSPDFKSIRVMMVVTFANRQAPDKKSPAWRLGAGLVYAQSVTSVVELRDGTSDMNENVALWAANDGARAKEALTRAFADVAEMAPRAFVLTQAEAKAMQSGKAHKMKTYAGFMGREQTTDTNDVLLFNGGYIHITKI